MDSPSGETADDELLGAVNLMILGEGAVGKSCMLQTYCGDAADAVKSATIGVDVCTRVACVRGLPAKLQFYDTAGSERFRALIRQQYGRAHGVLLVFDFTQRETFLRLDGWLKEVRAAARQQPIIMLAGNKAELAERRAVSVPEADAFARQHGLAFRTLSAFNAVQVGSVLDDLAHRVLLTPRLYRPAVEATETYVLLLKLQTHAHMRAADAERRLAAVEDRLAKLEKTAPDGSGD
ncbi:ras-related protein RABB1b-like [Pollicipes pollicipes]|uniref:ras-related protein RABB1b-like n=1 Tax=Pollicipes pollicipes TaxID=41117 RepID=UPI00188516B5|nr:ras-related protein RABB1b-like [Pollicipes pollicipes]